MSSDLLVTLNLSEPELAAVFHPICTAAALEERANRAAVVLAQSVCEHTAAVVPIAAQIILDSPHPLSAARSSPVSAEFVDAAAAVGESAASSTTHRGLTQHQRYVNQLPIEPTASSTTHSAQCAKRTHEARNCSHCCSCMDDRQAPLGVQTNAERADTDTMIHEALVKQRARLQGMYDRHEMISQTTHIENEMVHERVHAEMGLCASERAANIHGIYTKYWESNANGMFEDQLSMMRSRRDRAKFGSN